MNKLIYLFIVLLASQSFCQEIDTTSRYELEGLPLEELTLLEGTWDVQAFHSLEEMSLPKSLYFRPLKMSLVDSLVELTYTYFDPHTGETFEEMIQLRQDENDKSLFLFDLEDRRDWFRIVFHEEMEKLILTSQSEIEVIEGGETEFEREIPIDSIENLEMEGEMIDVGSGITSRFIEGHLMIVEIHLRDWHLLLCITKDFDGVYDFRRFLRENEISYIINKDYYQFPIVPKFIHPIAENFKQPNLEGEWRLLAVYETEEFGRLFPWELGYCPQVKLDISDQPILKIDFKLDLLYGGSVSRIWTVFPREDEVGVISGFVGDRPIPIGVVDLKDDGLLVAVTNDGASFLVATPDWKGEDLTQDDINYFKGILNDKVKLEVSDFYLYLFYSDECVE